MTSSLFLTELLASSNNPGYGTKPIPCQRDFEITNILRAWMELTPARRQAESERISDDQRFVFLAFSERMASYAVRKHDRDLLVLGLVMLGLGGLRGDWRDGVPIMSLHYDAAARLGISSETVFTEAATWLDTKEADALRSFPCRSLEDKSLESMGYVVAADRDGFRYQRTW